MVTKRGCNFLKLVFVFEIWLRILTLLLHKYENRGKILKENKPNFQKPKVKNKIAIKEHIEHIYKSLLNSKLLLMSM